MHQLILRNPRNNSNDMHRNNSRIIIIMWGLLDISSIWRGKIS